MKRWVQRLGFGVTLATLLAAASAGTPTACQPFSVALASDFPPSGLTVTNPADSLGEGFSASPASIDGERLVLATAGGAPSDPAIALGAAEWNARMAALLAADQDGFAKSAGRDGALPAIASADASAVRTAIESADARWTAALRSGDEKALAGIYAADASLVPPHSESIEGRENILAWLAERHRAGAGETTLKTIDVVSVGDVAYEVGHYGFEVGDGETAVATDSGRYFAIWKRQSDGQWLCQVGIWSSSRDVVASR